MGPLSRRNQPAPEPKYADVYRHAARLIRQHGWCHHGAVGKEGEICVHIAITQAAADRLPDEEMRAPVQAAARWLDPNHRSGSAVGLIRWNEAEERTVEDVLGLLHAMST